MAKDKKSLLRLLRLLYKKPMTKGEIRNPLKVNRKTVYVNIKEALKQRWIEEDELKRYHLT
jgi:predicted transcriptional regulator